MESFFIDASLSSAPDKCDNEKDGAESFNDQMPDSNKFYVYVDRIRLIILDALGIVDFDLYNVGGEITGMTIVGGTY